jgi:hypothetical protein
MTDMTNNTEPTHTHLLALTIAEHLGLRSYLAIYAKAFESDFSYSEAFSNPVVELESFLEDKWSDADLWDVLELYGFDPDHSEAADDLLREFVEYGTCPSLGLGRCTEEELFYEASIDPTDLADWIESDLTNSVTDLTKRENLRKLLEKALLKSLVDPGA